MEPNGSARIKDRNQLSAMIRQVAKITRFQAAVGRNCALQATRMQAQVRLLATAPLSARNSACSTTKGDHQTMPSSMGENKRQMPDPSTKWREEQYQEHEEVTVDQGPAGIEFGGPQRGGKFKEPTRFGDWERKGRCSDF